MLKYLIINFINLKFNSKPNSFYKLQPNKVDETRHNQGFAKLLGKLTQL